MLPARYRMTRSADFSLTVSRGVRASQPDLVVHALHSGDDDLGAPKVGLVVSKSVGSAVQRHRVARKLRHVARDVLADLRSGDKLVIRALPGSVAADSGRLEQELRTALRKTQRPVGVAR